MRQFWKPGNLLNPVPAVLVTAADAAGHVNVMTAAWTGNLCSDPVYVSVSIRPERYTHHMIEETGEFVLNLTTRGLVRAADYCGVRSGRDEDKFATLGLELSPSRFVKAPGIAQSPVCLECRVENVLRLGSHDVYVARVLSADVDDRYLDEKGRLDLGKADLITYCHGEYFALGEKLGTFGFSVKKKAKKKPDNGRHS